MKTVANITMVLCPNTLHCHACTHTHTHTHTHTFHAHTHTKHNSTPALAWFNWVGGLKYKSNLLCVDMELAKALSLQFQPLPQPHPQPRLLSPLSPSDRSAHATTPPSEDNYYGSLLTRRPLHGSMLDHIIHQLTCVQ